MCRMEEAHYADPSKSSGFTFIFVCAADCMFTDLLFFVVDFFPLIFCFIAICRQDKIKQNTKIYSWIFISNIVLRQHQHDKDCFFHFN